MGPGPYHVLLDNGVALEVDAEIVVERGRWLEFQNGGKTVERINSEHVVILRTIPKVKAVKIHT